MPYDFRAGSAPLLLTDRTIFQGSSLPLHLEHYVSRRSILRSALAAGAGGILMGCSTGGGDGGGRFDAESLAAKKLSAEKIVRPPADRWAILSDLHVSADENRTHWGANLATLAKEAVAGVLALDTPPAGVIVNGDCAFLTGQLEDYSRFTQICVNPVVSAGLPLHLSLGNHDHRDRFRTALQQSADEVGAIAGGHCVSIVEGQHARLFMLDSLDRTNAKSGKIGDPQLDWLDASLEALDDRPAVIVGHHPIGFGSIPAALFGALRDGGALWTVLRKHAHVKAYFYGHTHRWNIDRRDGIHLVNLPTTAYLFDWSQPRGWVDASFHAQGAELKLNPVGNTSKRRAETVCLKW